MGFSASQLRALRSEMQSQHVRTRQSNNGRSLSYIEAWHAIAEANRIFGFDGWNRETVESRCVLAREVRGTFHAIYIAKVRLSVRAKDTTIIREGFGTGEAHGSLPGEAHDMAIKTAETDATKRALATFGKPFGLALYLGHRPRAHEPTQAPLDQERPGSHECNGSAPPQTGNGATRPSGVDQQTVSDEAAATNETTRSSGRYRAASNDNGTMDRSSATALPNHERRRTQQRLALSGRYYVPPRPAPIKDPVLETKASTQTSVSPVAGADNAADHTGAEPSALLIERPRRRREPGHLKFVASQPCLLCGRLPSDAHHLRFAQPQAMSRKVSDEFVVPLCRTHHRQLHHSGNETAWWNDLEIDALAIARSLWDEFRGRENPSIRPAVQGPEGTLKPTNRGSSIVPGQRDGANTPADGDKAAVQQAPIDKKV